MINRSKPTMETHMHPTSVTARAICLLLPLAMVVACSRDTERSAPVTTTTPDGQSSAPSADAAEQRDTALVRVVHAVPGGKPVDVYAGDARVFEKVNFKDVTAYKELDGQRYSFNIFPAGTAVTPGLGTAGSGTAGSGTAGDAGRATPGAARTGNARGSGARGSTVDGSAGIQDALASNSEGLTDGDYYTIFALPGNQGKAAMLRVVQDRHVRPSESKARVRVVNAAASVDEIDVYAQGVAGALVAGVDFQSISDYDEVDPHSGALEIRAEGQTAPVTTVPSIRFDPGKSYTVIVVSNQGRTPRLEAFVIEDVVGAPTITDKR
jgi:hypothetical protein